MTIKIDKGQEDALALFFVDIINLCKVDYNQYMEFSSSINFKSFEENLSSESIEKIYRYCGISGISAFIKSEINGQLQSSYKFKSSEKGKTLKDFIEFSDAISSAKNIIAKLKSLPNRYRLTVPLPLSLSSPLLPFLSAIKISENAIICKSSRLPDDFPLSNKNTNLDEGLFSDPFDDEFNTDRSLNEYSLYLSIVETGYCSRTDSSLESSFFDKMRAIYGAGIALNFFSYHYASSSEKRPFILVHTEGGSRELIETIDLESDLWHRRNYRSTKDFVKSSEDPSLSLRAAFNKIGTILGSSEFARRLFTACIWLYRANNNSSQLDSLLQSTIAMEVLLGDRETADFVGLSRLLANRCAYLLGISRSDRQEIIEQFQAVYKLRSAIVHGGKHRIERQDRSTIASCLTLCGRVISRELELHHAANLSDSGV